MRWIRAAGIAVGLGTLFVPGLVGPAFGLVVVVASLAVRDPGVLRHGMRLGVALTLLFAASITVGTVSLVSGWERGLVNGFGLILRFLLLWLVSAWLSRSVSGDQLIRWSRRMRLGPVGDAVGLAVNLLPLLTACGHDVVRASRQRGLPWWRGWAEILEVLLAHSARLGNGAAAAAALRGHIGLSRCGPIRGPCGAPVVVVTGRPGVGKTTAVEGAVEQLAGDGIAVAGVVQPGVFDGDEKTGFLIRDLRSGLEAPFASRVEREVGELGTRFRFAAAGTDLARRALRGGHDAPILVVDELGPLELRGGGHAEAVRRRLVDPHLACALLVVRRHLVPALLASLDARDAVVIDIEGTSDPARRIHAAVVGRLDPDQGVA